MKPFVRSATFVDNQSLLLTDGDTNLWRFDLPSGRTVLACEGEAVLAPIARAFPDKPRLARACAGTYPQVASAEHGLRVVVNPSDMVLILGGLECEWRLAYQSYGNYYPRIEFSADASLISCVTEGITVFEVSSGQQVEVVDGDDYCAAAWHPNDNELLAVTFEGRVDRIRFATNAASTTENVAELPESSAETEAVYWGTRGADGASALVFSGFGEVRLVNLMTGEIRLTASLGRLRDGVFSRERPLALLKRDGQVPAFELWDLRSLERVVTLPVDATCPCFSPNGEFLFYLSRLPSNPYPGAHCTTPRKGVLWKIEI